MNYNDPVELKEFLNRTAKLDVDGGSVADFEQAVRRLETHRVQVRVGSEVARSASHQAALLTVVNIAHRFALGGVFIEGDLSAASLIGADMGLPLGEAVRKLGGTDGKFEPGLPTIVIGTVSDQSEPAIIVTFEGWRGGVVRRSSARLSELTSVMPAAVLAGAIATAEAFSMLRGNVEAGRRAVGLSLWRPDASGDWLGSMSNGPELVALPDHLWVLGLGHLGQAFLWTLMLCDFPEPQKVRLTLQDMDRVSISTQSTSILSWPGRVGERKTRDVGSILEARGFQTTLIERPFDGNFRHDGTMDPAVLVCGVDNALARARLETPGFPFIVEAGIGHTSMDFSALRVHTFPSSGKSAAELWSEREARRIANLDKPAYKRLADGARNVCGLERLAETAVGVPFVGTVGGCIMLAEVLRLLSGDQPDKLVDLDLRSMKSRRAFVNSFDFAVVPSFQALPEVPIGAQV
ncbi:hypothetical protein J5J10_01895 [Ciceribacter sp. L1K23]|uniref:hypothetical protein n=1 Tax=Ciceribacter sp. L1K23 TaxID=2820276 RepID=UPI001B83DD8A|nr:hypothetical protein [Ciceribacter sp. L1K23]MBR0554416.1 hypothetical protein [Ciceribacter sp. L1K23]